MKLLITIDVEGTMSTANQENPYKSVEALESFLEEIEQPVTLFVTPGVVKHRSDVVRRWLEDGITVGLHLHPTRMEGGKSDRLGDYNRETIEEFLITSSELFEERLGMTPTCFRAGRWEYSDQLLEALRAQGFERDSSLKPDDSIEPYSSSGIREYPLTIYSNPGVNLLTKPWAFNSIPLHADAFLINPALALGFYAITRRLVNSDRPYIMVSYHDYDILDETLKKRLKRYHRFLDEWTTSTTLDEI